MSDQRAGWFRDFLYNKSLRSIEYSVSVFGTVLAPVIESLGGDEAWADLFPWAIWTFVSTYWFCKKSALILDRRRQGLDNQMWRNIAVAVVALFFVALFGTQTSREVEALCLSYGGSLSCIGSDSGDDIVDEPLDFDGITMSDVPAICRSIAVSNTNPPIGSQVQECYTRGGCAVHSFIEDTIDTDALADWEITGLAQNAARASCYDAQLNWILLVRDDIQRELRIRLWHESVCTGEVISMNEGEYDRLTDDQTIRAEIRRAYRGVRLVEFERCAFQRGWFWQ